MEFLDSSEKLIKRTIVIIMCTSAKYINFITSKRWNFFMWSITIAPLLTKHTKVPPHKPKKKLKVLN
jgi:hypothetical protein